MTKEQKKEAAEKKREQMKQLSDDIRRMSATEKEGLVAQFGARTCEGHMLSPHNAMMLIAQSKAAHVECPTVIAGFQQWKRNGRTVTKGQHGMSIYVPCKGKKVDEDSDSSEPPKRKRMFFKAVAVFDISQTHESGNGTTAPPTAQPAAPAETTALAIVSRFAPLVPAPTPAQIAPASAMQGVLQLC